MIEIKINGNKYEINKLRIKDLYVIQDLQLTENLRDRVKFISALSGCPEEDLLKLKNYQFKSIEVQVAELMSKKSSNIPFLLVLQDMKFGLVHFDELSVGEFADIEIILSDINYSKKLHEFMSIIYRPITGSMGSTYTIDEYDHKACQARAYMFLEMEVDQLEAVTDFFFSLEKESIKAMLDSLEVQARKIMKKGTSEIKQLLSPLLEDGTFSFCDLVDKTPLECQRHLDSISEQLLTILAGQKTKLEDSKKNIRNN